MTTKRNKIHIQLENMKKKVYSFNGNEIINRNEERKPSTHTAITIKKKNKKWNGTKKIDGIAWIKRETNESTNLCMGAREWEREKHKEWKKKKNETTESPGWVAQRIK